MKKINLLQTLLLLLAVLLLGISVFYLLKPEVFADINVGKSGMDCQIFYGKPLPTLYIEKQSLHSTVKKRYNSGYDTVHFLLPFRTPLNKLRIDWGNDKNIKLKIFSISLELCGGAFQKKLYAEKIKNSIYVNSQMHLEHFSEKYLLFRTVGHDPYLLFDFSRTPWEFHITARFCFLILLFFTGILIFCFFYRILRSVMQIKHWTACLVRKFFTSPNCLQRVQPWHCICVLFILAVILGLTGSSIGFIRTYGICEPVGEWKILGKYRPIRSDEYNAHGTASAIQNTVCSPRFPLLNRNIGLSGRNFLFLHDWGAPVKHPAILVRPATWGFFFLPLRNALAWYWFFPIFFGWFLFYLLMQTLFPGGNQWMFFLLAGGMVFSPYAAVWSFWPVNCGAGALGAVALLSRMMAAKSKTETLLLGGAAGWCFAVSAATLYYPHIWPCVSLAIVLGICKIIPGFLHPAENSCPLKWKSFSLLLFCLVNLFLLFLFFSAIQEPLKIAMQSESGRRIRPGGLFTAWDLIRGWFFYYSDAENNICEMQSYQLILPALGVCLLQFFRKIKDKLICSVLFFFGVFVLEYQYIGLPDAFAFCIGWYHTTEPRCCYALQIVQLLLLAGLCAVPHSSEDRSIRRKNAVSALVFALFFTFIFLLLMCYVKNWLWAVNSLNMAPLLLGTTVLFFFGTAFLLMYHIKAGAVLFALAVSAIGICFNPLCIAPRKMYSPLVQTIKALPGQQFGGRILLAADAMAAACQQHWVMGGGTILNGFFCYEDPELFQLFFKNMPNPGRFHRLNHMSLSVNRNYMQPISAEIPQGDCIRLLINGEKYDFSQIPADFLLVSEAQKNNGLENNKTVQYISKARGWSVWRISHQTDLSH